MHSTRRTFLGSTAAGIAHAFQVPGPTILVRSGWQSVNIGDVAHTPGLLHVLRQNIPGVRLILWPNEVEHGAAPMLERAFPGVQILGKGSSETAAAMAKADLFLHGSGPSVVGQDALIAWTKSTDKPAGVLGVTFSIAGDPGGSAPKPALVEALNKCRFVYTRETLSLQNLKNSGVHAPVMGFAPDATFSMDLTDEARAKPFLEENKLENGKFIAVIPRLRYTPYHLIRKTNLSAEETARREAVNDREKEKDNAKLREMIVAWVRKTHNRVLLCAEMTYELDVIDPLLYDPLPDDVKPFVVRRKTFWLPDEAASVYARAAAVISCECHSPILAICQGTPCLYVHEPEDGIKGHMWIDVGLRDWYFEIDKTSGAELASKLLALYSHNDASRAKAREVRNYARKLDTDGVNSVKRALSKA